MSGNRGDATRSQNYPVKRSTGIAILWSITSLIIHRRDIRELGECGDIEIAREPEGIGERLTISSLRSY